MDAFVACAGTLLLYSYWCLKFHGAYDKLLVAQLKKLRASVTLIFSKVIIRFQHWSVLSQMK
jgi:hypothetical protein